MLTVSALPISLSLSFRLSLLSLYLCPSICDSFDLSFSFYLFVSLSLFVPLSLSLSIPLSLLFSLSISLSLQLAR